MLEKNFKSWKELTRNLDKVAPFLSYNDISLKPCLNMLEYFEILMNNL